jgi:hypothetical protein
VRPRIRCTQPVSHHGCMPLCLASVCAITSCCAWAANNALLILTATTARIHPGPSSVGSCKELRCTRNCSQHSSPCCCELTSACCSALCLSPSSPCPVHAVQSASRVLALCCKPVPYNPLSPAQRLRPTSQLPIRVPLSTLAHHHATSPPLCPLRRVHLLPAHSPSLHHSQPIHYHTQVAPTRRTRQLLLSGLSIVS